MPHIEMQPHAFGPYSTLWSAHRIAEDGKRSLLFGTWFLHSGNEKKVEKSALRQAPGLPVIRLPMSRKDRERLRGFPFSDAEWLEFSAEAAA